MAERSTVNGRRVLIVEDDPRFGNLLVEVLRAAGHQADLAATRAAALDAIAGRTPDVLCVDLDLPDGTGWALLDDLDSRGVSISQVVVASAGLHSAKAHRRPGTFFLPKPFPIDSLLRLVRGDELPEI
jgi:DNA-binding response OmpR family regulator